jgi:uncharacterized BrkB/YihY/UPF0761 family membrane protein
MFEGLLFIAMTLGIYFYIVLASSAYITVKNSDHPWKRKVLTVLVWPFVATYLIIWGTFYYLSYHER